MVGVQELLGVLVDLSVDVNVADEDDPKQSGLVILQS